MALRKRGKTWWTDVAVNGQRYRQSLKTTDRREALGHERDLVRRIEDGKVGSASSRTFARLGLSQAADIYLAEREGKVAERTIDFETERLVRLRGHFKKLPLNKIPPT